MTNFLVLKSGILPKCPICYKTSTTPVEGIVLTVRLNRSRILLRNVAGKVLVFLFVYLETRHTVAEEFYCLMCGGYTGIDIGLRCLCSHFFWCEEYTVAESLFQGVGSVGTNICNVFEIGTGIEPVQPRRSLPCERCLSVRLPLALMISDHSL